MPNPNKINVEPSLRRYPYPYQAMLAICSDQDETPNKEVYFECSRYLNTQEKTTMGQGLNLEVGNSIYFHMPKDQFSYFNTDDDGRGTIHKLIQSGHIDCLHSFGDLASSREQAIECLNNLRANNSYLEVWIDHAQAPSNLDADIMEGIGAQRGSACYHADVTGSYGGLTFVWKGRVTSSISQNSKARFRGIFNKNHPIISLKTMGIEAAKVLLSYLGSAKYQMHKNNQIMRNTTLDDGSEVVEFMRMNPSWGGVSHCETAKGISQVLTNTMLKHLLSSQGCSVLYTHLGKIHTKQEPFDQATREAFRLLSKYSEKKQILTTTTRRILGYCRTRDELKFNIIKKSNETHIMVSTCYEGRDLQGLTWYVSSPSKTKLFINGKKWQALKNNPKDYSGRPSVSIVWEALVYPNTISGITHAIN
ncbi:MAG: hypothetical protein V3U78_03650 [Thiotrichaceae bacterium]